MSSAAAGELGCMTDGPSTSGAEQGVSDPIRDGQRQGRWP